MAWVVLFSLLLVLAGAISIIYPLRFLRVYRRRQGFGLLFAGACLFLAAGSQLKSPTNPTAVVEQPKIDEAASTEQKSKEISQPQPTRVVSAVPPAVASDLQPIPASETGLYGAITKARETYSNGSNDMQRGAARPLRARAICSLLKTKTVSGWIGTVERLSTNGDGKGILSVKLPGDFIVTTTNNSFGDAIYPSLIDPSSRLFQSASQLSQGQKIRFSGSFFPSDTDCIAEQSITLRGSISNPEFVMRFASVEVIN